MMLLKGFGVGFQSSGARVRGSWGWVRRFGIGIRGSGAGVRGSGAGVRGFAAKSPKPSCQARSPNTDFANGSQIDPVRDSPWGMRFLQGPAGKVVGLHSFENGFRGFGWVVGEGVQQRGVRGRSTSPEGRRIYYFCSTSDNESWCHSIIQTPKKYIRTDSGN